MTTRTLETPPGAPPQVVVVMGVSGVGKSSVGLALAQRLGWVYAEGDDFHSTAAVAAMAAGRALTDADRMPWLLRIRDWVTQSLARGQSAVVTCSALRRTYRDVLRAGDGSVRFLLLELSEDELAARLSARTGHFMPASLLASQLATLEPLTSAERASGDVVVSASGPLPTVVDRAVEALF